MKVAVRIAKSFKTAVKPLLKKYPSLSGDLLALQTALTQNPKLGTHLGQNVFKIRLKITSKGTGKSGGARVISLVDTELVGEVLQTDHDISVNLITIYDKAQVASISDKELKALVAQFRKD